MATDDKAADDRTRTELEAAVYRRLVEHPRDRTDVQNIDLMNLAGFCRNCLSNWMKEAADAKGMPMTKDESREIVYGMPYDEWRAKHQKEASPDQKAAFEKTKPHHWESARCRTAIPKQAFFPRCPAHVNSVDDRRLSLT